jgi:photosystem II stability/assembly factor-like uncharacterized protein
MFDEKLGLICGEDGLIGRTTNAGLTWNVVPHPDGDGVWYDIFFINENTGFISGENRNGIKMTTDAGFHWDRIGSPPADAFSLYAFDIENIFTSSTDGRVYYTSNGGHSWDEIQTGSTDTLWKINFYDKVTAVVCGMNNAVLMTTNRGSTWAPFDKNLPDNNWYDIDFQDDETITPVSESFSTTQFPPSGWSLMNNSGASMWERSTVSAYLSPACAWSNFDPVMGDNIMLTPELEITSGDHLTFYLRRSYTGTIFNWDSLEVFVTARGGNTNRVLEPLMRIGLNSKDTSLSSYPPRIGTYKKYHIPLNKYVGNIVQVGFRHKNTDGTGIRVDEILVGTYRTKKLKRVYLTGNRTNVYRNTIFPLPTSEQPWIPLPFINSGQIYKGDALSTAVLGEDSLIVAGVNGFVNKSFSSTGNQSYSDRTTENNLLDLWTNNDGKKIISVGSAGVVLTSPDEGNTWDYNKISEGSLYSISMIDENTGWISGSEGHLYRTTNAGKTWDKSVNHKSINTLFNAFYEVNFVDPKVGWAFGENGVVIKTTNGGESWSRQKTLLPDDTPIYDSYMLNRNVGYFVGAFGLIEKTVNGGDSWVRLNYNNQNTNLRNIYMLDEDNGWVCGEKGMLLKTTDGGNSWESIPIPYPYSDLYGVQFSDINNGMVVGESGKTFRTSDGGASWEFENSGATDHYSLQIISPEITYISSSTGNIVKFNGAAELDRTTTYFNNSKVFEELTLEQNYPNPFNPSTLISFSIPKPGNVSLKVYDIAGREIASLINNELLNNGSYSKSFNAENLSSGVYFYSLIINGEISATKRMLLIK